jgi:hypothetical protein
MKNRIVQKNFNSILKLKIFSIREKLQLMKFFTFSFELSGENIFKLSFENSETFSTERFPEFRIMQFQHQHH